MVRLFVSSWALLPKWYNGAGDMRQIGWLQGMCTSTGYMEALRQPSQQIYKAVSSCRRGEGPAFQTCDMYLLIPTLLCLYVCREKNRWQGNQEANGIYYSPSSTWQSTEPSQSPSRSQCRHFKGLVLIHYTSKPKESRSGNSHTRLQKGF